MALIDEGPFTPPTNNKMRFVLQHILDLFWGENHAMFKLSFQYTGPSSAFRKWYGH